MRLTGGPAEGSPGGRDLRAVLAEGLRLIAAAARFLTRLPLPASPHEPGDLRRAAGAFPLVGLAVAGIGIAARAAVEPLLGPGPATITALAVMVAVTGALHEDGLADTVDGLWGGGDPARRLAIMRDSRVGTYGVLALVAVLGMRAALLLPLDLGGFARAVACGAVLGRAAWLPLVRLLPSAAPGLGAELEGPQPAAGAVTAAILVTATLALATGWWAPIPLLAGALALAWSTWLLRRRLGGYTGDTLGFVEQVVELAALATVAALLRAGAL